MKTLTLVLALWTSIVGVGAQTLAVAPVLPILVTSSDGLKADGGQSVELVREAARRARIDIDVQIQPWSRAIQTATRAPNVLLFPVLRTPDRESTFEWLGPVNRAEYWVVRRSAGTAPAIKTLAELDGKSIGILANSGVGSFLHTQLPKATFQEVNKYASLGPMLLADRFEYLLIIRGPFLVELDQIGSPRTAVQMLFPVKGILSDPNSYLVVAKDSDPALVQGLRQAMQSMVTDGTWEKIYRKYQ
jgi:polar amino acid transport system substrate-binding protein